MKTNHAAGLAAEAIAEILLRLKGYRVLARRYKTLVGEIDLIVKRGRTIAFIEVKRRNSAADALAATNSNMRNRIERAAGHFLSRFPQYANLTLRFDLIAIAPPFYYRHLDNAWRPNT